MKYLNLVSALASMAAGLAIAGSAVAAPTIWLVDAGQKLGKVDAATGVVSGVVSTGQTFTDIAFDPVGGLWGITFFDLFRINQTTGAATFVGNLGAPENVNALVFGADGTLWAAGTRLYKVNTTTGAATSLGNAGTSYQSAGDLAFVNGSLYLSTTQNNLVKLNTTTGGATNVGSFGTTEVYGLATPDHNSLYGVRGTQVFSVNPATGAGSSFVSYGGQGLGVAYGSAFIGEAAPVPEPETYAMFLAGLVFCAMVNRRRTRRDA